MIDQSQVRQVHSKGRSRGQYKRSLRIKHSSKLYCILVIKAIDQQCKRLPDGQAHVKLEILSTQVPLLTHTSAVQSSMFVSHSRPVKPSEQLRKSNKFYNNTMHTEENCQIMQVTGLQTSS